MNLATMRANLRTMLAALGQYSDADIDRSVEMAVAVLSKYHSRQQLAVIVYNESVKDETFTSNHGTWVALVNSPIRFGSETVATAASGGTSYKRDTDYEMDYAGGRIKTLTAGAIVNTTTTYIDYKNEGAVVNTSGLFTEPISIDLVNVRTADEVPQVLEGWYQYGNYLFIGPRGIKNQSYLVDNAQITIYYRAMHDEPTVGASGSYPRSMDELVLLGASGYLLITESLRQFSYAGLDTKASRRALLSSTLTHASIGSLQGRLLTAHKDADTALDKVMNGIQGASQSIKDEANKANMELAEAYKVLRLVDTGTRSPYTEAMRLIGAVTPVVFQVNSALSRITTHATATTNSAKASLDLVNAELLLLNSALDNINGHVSRGEQYIVTGWPSINKINQGLDVPETYRRYAELEAGWTGIARIRVEEAAGRAQHGQALTLEAAQRLSLAELFVNEAATHIRKMDSMLQQADGMLALGERKVSLARGYIEAASQHVGVANTRWLEMQGYLSEATGRLAQVEHILSDITSKLTEVTTYISEAQAYQNNVVSLKAIGDSLRDEGATRLVSFFRALQEQGLATSPRVNATGVKQYAG